MTGKRAPIVVGAIAIALSACSSEPDAPRAPVAANLAAPVATATPAAVATPAPAVAGFDPASAPIATPTLGAWPYFSLIDGYVAMTRENSPGDSSKDYLRDVAFDRYELFDGHKLIPIEGRLMTVRANGKGASFFEAKKTYERLVQAQGGVTVWEGSGKVMAAKKIAFEDKRFRAYYVEHDEMGLYMIRAADREIWVEVYKPYNTAADNYWLTVMERRTLQERATVLPAAEMKRALDAEGRVALYVNFDTDQTAIRLDSQPLIVEVVKLLEADPILKISVDGHTDDRGTEGRNMTLAQGRADAVVAALTAQGIAASRLKARSFGQAKPIASNANETGKARNRRVELVKL